jgi:hypothetical protein
VLLSKTRNEISDKAQLCDRKLTTQRALRSHMHDKRVLPSCRPQHFGIGQTGTEMLVPGSMFLAAETGFTDPFCPAELCSLASVCIVAPRARPIKWRPGVGMACRDSDLITLVGRQKADQIILHGTRLRSIPGPRGVVFDTAILGGRQGVLPGVLLPHTEWALVDGQIRNSVSRSAEVARLAEERTRAAVSGSGVGQRTWHE